LPEKPDWITFTSSSTVRNFVAMAGAEAIAGVLAGVKVASIGPITSATARELGIEVTVEASVFTMDGLVEAILRAVSSTVSTDAAMRVIITVRGGVKEGSPCPSIWST
jgi:uroporphyrinogen-III synthase